jgi:hypothetical protein
LIHSRGRVDYVAITSSSGKKWRLFGTPGVPGPYHELSPNEAGAKEAEKRAIAKAFADAAKAAVPAPPEKEEVPTFGDWFNGRFWREWVVAQKENHRREIPEGILAAGAGESDPDARIIRLLGARGSHVAAVPGSTKKLLLF